MQHYSIKLYLVCFSLLSSVSASIDDNNVDLTDYQPSQVHISLGNKSDEIMITWVTSSKTRTSLVEYGIEGFYETAKGVMNMFQDFGKLKRKFYIHRVLLTNLKPNTTYEYHCGSEAGWSNLFFFHTLPEGQESSLRFAVFGDMGYINAISLPLLQKETQSRMYDAFLHVGDLAYNLDTDNGIIGDNFMNQIQSIAAYVPYMTAPGNHEVSENFLHYRKRFSMPGNTEGIYYSFNMGPVHFVVISTEVYYFLNYGYQPLLNQYNWLQQDLKEATAPENRTLRPWIITLGHRPMYCTTKDNDDCKNLLDRVRVGLPPLFLFGLEDLFYDYGVDIEIWGHEHTYERSWPLYNYEVYNGSSKEPYTDPKAPVHLIIGSAGCTEHVDAFENKTTNWSAFRSSDYGYSRMHVLNKTHIHFEQISAESNGTIIDDYWVVKTFHAPYPKREKSLKLLREVHLSEWNFEPVF